MPSITFDKLPDDYERVSPELFRKALATASNSEALTASTRFENVKDSGIEFTNFLSRSSSEVLLETGSGVAIGDYDNDGLQDVYLTGSDVANRLFRNLGNLKFEDVTESAGVDGRFQDNLVAASGASFADIDNDGDLDLYVCNMAAPNLLYINQNDGTFEEQTYARNVQYLGASKQANFCDYDRDGDLDFYLLTYEDSFVKPNSGDAKRDKAGLIDGRQIGVGEPDILFQNDGTGVFTDVTAQAGIAGYDFGLGCVWFDYDDDGWQDLYVGSDFKMPDHLYKNNRDGTFTDVLAETVSRTPWFSMGMDSGDLNNDGLLDLMVGDMAEQTHYRQKVNMGDMDQDGWFLKQGKPRQFMKNCVYLNSGEGRFLEAAGMTGMAKSNWTWSIRMADLDNNGLLDIFITNGHARDMMNSDLSNKHKKMVKELRLSQDETDKLYTTVPAKKDTNLAFANQGGLVFEPSGKSWGLDHTGVSHSAAFADLDLDGDLDCVVNNYYEPTLIYRNDSSQGARLLVELRCDKNNFFGVGSKVEIWQGDLYQRRDLQPARGYLSSDPMVLHFGVNKSAPIDRLKVTWPDGTSQQFTDLVGNSLYRVLESSQRKIEAVEELSVQAFADRTVESKFDFTHTESDFDDYTREPLLPFQLSRLGGGLSVADINGDGYPDVYCGGAAGQSGKLLVNRGGKTFEPLAGPWDEDIDNEDMGALFFDADGDGDVDLYVASGGNECDAASEQLKDRLYLCVDGEHYQRAEVGTLPNVTDSSSSVAAADFDRDGDLDLFIGARSIPGQYPLTPSSRLLVNDGGKFNVAPESDIDGLKEVGLVNSALWTDYDGDGWIDLVVVPEWGPVTFFQNEEGRLTNVTKAVGLDEHLGWWHGIAAGDLDHDGDMDYVVTNQGTNTKYHATANRPHRLYYDDFDKSGTIDLVEAEFEGDVEYPVRGRSCSSRCMPFIKDKFETFHDFSVASLADIYETDKVERPVLELNHLESSILWNNGDDGFRIEALDRLAQISPGYGVSVFDYDGDSKLDILMATNFFGGQPETGYMDGGVGWLLKGRGDGRFIPQWPNESGIVVPGDSNGLAIADWDQDGDQDAFFAINNDSFRMLENQSVPPKHLNISLVGPIGNRSAIGSRVTLIGKDNYRRVVELGSGGSYLSQSALDVIQVFSEERAQITSATVAWPDGTNQEISLEGTADSLTIEYDNKK